MHNENFYDVLRQRKLVLEDKIRFLEKYSNLIPDLRFKVSKQRGKERYYYKNKLSDEYKYISNAEEIHRLLVIYYAQKALIPLKRELSHINRILEKNTEEEIQSLINRNSDKKNSLLKPDALEICDDLYTKMWLSEKYEPKGFSPRTPKIYSLSGKRVRSKSEASIINCLEARNVPYYYEYPIYIDGIYYHPDFRILRIRDRKVIFWEHWGSMDDPEYVAEQLRKLEEYKKVGIELGKNLFVTMESRLHPLNIKIINKFIDDFLV